LINMLVALGLAFFRLRSRQALWLIGTDARIVRSFGSYNVLQGVLVGTIGSDNRGTQLLTN
jgi:hypothetical protein